MQMKSEAKDFSTKSAFSAPGRELRDLLAPLEPEIFIKEYWERKPLHIRGGKDKFRGLFDLEKFHDVARRARPISADFGAGMHLDNIQHPHLDALFKAGATICLNDITKATPELANLAAAVQAQLNYAGGVSIRSYLSGEGHGFDVHFDTRIATTLQIEGKKRWRFSNEPAMPFPPNVRNSHFRPADVGPRDSVKGASVEVLRQVSPPDPSKFSEVVLEPGDILCLPAGAWHEAKAVGGTSLALNLAFDYRDFFNILTAAVVPILVRNPDWRRPPPPSISREGDALPEEVRDFFAARLAELAAVLSKLDPDGPELKQAWRPFSASR